MENLLLIGICFLLGMGLKRFGIVGDKGAETLNAVIIYMSMPAMILLYAHDLVLSLKLLYPVLMGIWVFILGYAVALLGGKLLGLDRRTVICLVLTAGLGNTSFLGLPMIEAYYGEDLLGLGILCDQGGFFMLVIPGIILAAGASGESIRPRTLVKKIIFFPPFLALIAGLALHPVPYPDWTSSLLAELASTLSPLALLSVGMNLRFGSLKGNTVPLALGMACKLLLAPLLIMVLYVFLMGQSGPIMQVTIFEAAMPPMVMGGIIAMLYGLNKDLAALMVGLGIPASFVTLAGWYWVLERI